MLDPIARTQITPEDLIAELKKIERQIAAAGNEEVEIVFLELKARREEKLKRLLMSGRKNT